MKEHGSYSPEMEVFLSTLGNKDEFEGWLLEDPSTEIIDELSKEYRFWKRKLERSNNDLEKNAIRTSPIFAAKEKVMDVLEDDKDPGLRGIVTGQIKLYLNWNHGFTHADLEDLSTGQLGELYFDYIAELEGSFTADSMGRSFRRPMSAFGGRSRLDMIKSGSPEDKVKLLNHFELGHDHYAS